jgi:hypothetical protein
MAKNRPIDDDQLVAIMQQEITTAFGYIGGRLSDARRLAMHYYLGQPYGDEADDESQVVTTEVRDTVESLLPFAIKVFLASDKIAEFQPSNEAEEEAADQATDYVNFIFFQDNPGFLIFYDWFKDAFLQKNGFVGAWWVETLKETEENYVNLTDAQIAVLAQDKTVEITAYSSVMPAPEDIPELSDATSSPPMPTSQQASGAPQPGTAPQAALSAPQAAPPAQPMPGMMPMQAPITLHNVTIKRKIKEGRVKIHAIPPEQLLIARRTVDFNNPPFIGWRMRKPIADWVAEGYDYDIVKTIPTDDQQDYNQESVERRSFNDENATTQYASKDPTMREVYITDCYIKIDLEGNGKAQLMRVAVGGSGGQGGRSIIVKKEKWDGRHPFATVCPIRLPHQPIGMSIADLIMDLQFIRSTVMRQVLNNMYKMNSQRMELPATAIGDNTIEDLLTNRPGGIIRTKVAGQLREINPTSIAPLAIPIIEQLDKEKQNRTGVVPLQQRIDPDMLQGTATGQQMMDDASVERIELMLRLMAEGGVVELFRIILGLVIRHQDTARAIKLRGKWVNMDPRSWNADMVATVNVGLGTGDKNTNLVHLNMIKQTQESILLKLGPHNPLVGLDQYYHTLAEMTKNAGFRSVEPFFTDPSEQPPMPDTGQQPSPEMMKVQGELALMKEKQQTDAAKEQAQMQADLQVSQAEAQHEAQAKQMQAMIDDRRAQEKQQMEMIRLQGELQLQREKIAADADLARAKMEQDKELALIEMNLKYMQTQPMAPQQVSPGALV